MPTTLTYQTIIQFRITISDDGKAGSPEVLKKFTSPISDSKQFNKKKPSVKSLESDFGEAEVI